ncbi:hypothetical protein [Rhodanobacter ginsengiterrae]|uniref:hypothetical protein n=1 Tax=Rhodanobacter ginsengiterrae TaxID=2008451 RepID=UPI003CE9F192
MHDSSRLFVELTPPTGGLLRLQRSLADSHRTTHRWQRWIPLGAALAASLLTLASLLPGVITRQLQTRQLISAMQASIAPSATGIRVVDGAALELPSANPDVRLYLMQSAAQASRH